MKIKNISQQDLNITVPVGSSTLTSRVKPNQVMYCEDKSTVTKQLVIYEKKKLIVIDKELEKPDYVENYKPFYESGTYFSMPKAMPKAPPIEIEEVMDESDIEEEVFQFESVGELEMDEESEPVAESPKRGRGRPKKPVTASASEKEKKKRGRPKKTIQ